MTRFRRATEAVCAQLDGAGHAAFMVAVCEIAEDAGRAERRWARETIRALPENANPAEVLRALDLAHRQRVRKERG